VTEDVEQLEAVIDNVTGNPVETLLVRNGGGQEGRVARSGRVRRRGRGRRRRRSKKLHAEAGKETAGERQQLAV